MAKKTFNFRLEDAVVEFLDDMAARAGMSRSEAVRQSAQVSAAILKAARRQSIARLSALRESYGDDAKLIVAVSQGEDGDPLGHLIIDGEAPGGVYAVPVVVPGGRVLVFLNIPGHGDLGEAVLASFAGEMVLIPEARFPLGELPWPPDRTKGIVIRLGDLDKIIEGDPMLAETVEA